MAVFSIVKLSELEGAMRIDAEYYKPEYLGIDRSIKRFSNYLLSQIIVSFSSGRNLPQVPYDIRQVAYIRTQNVRPILVAREGMTSVEPSVNKFDLLEEGDILFVRVGEGVGNSCIITPHWANNTFSDNVIRLKIKEINPYFVIVYLNSKLGSKYLERVKKGSARSLISKENVGLIRIYKPSEEIVSFCKNSVIEAQELIIHGENLYSQAETLLLEELGLKDFKPRYEKTYTANLSDAFSAHRIDAEYFQPAYEEVIRKIEDITELKPLGKLANRVKLKIKPENNKLYRYIEISDVLIDIGEVNYTERLGKDLPPNARIPVKGGELIISKVRPTRGAIGIIPYCLGENLICSSAFSVFNVNSPLKEYLYVITRSIIGRLQLEKPTKGTSYPTIEDLDVEKLRIPLLPLSTQQKIASLVQQSHEARRKAKELIEIAKRAVEIAIEKNEEEAKREVEEAIEEEIK